MDKGVVYPQLHKDIDCTNIIARMAYRNHTVVYPPPKYPPTHAIPEFTMDGEMPIKSIYYFRPEIKQTVTKFTMWQIQTLINKVLNGDSVNTYKKGRCAEDTLKLYANEMRGGRGVVIGTMQPWLEAILLAYGASHVTTLEYSKLITYHKQMSAYTPYTYAEMVLRNDVTQFDFGASFSSLEHSGLGRYTDPLNPYGDLEAMAQVWCMLKPGGLFVLAVPFSNDDSNYIVWNAHRVYGSKRLQHLTANWEVLQIVPCQDFHKVIVLRKQA
jgi:hypothetical protein